MKKLILMTSALTMMGGAAFAGIEVTGEASVTYGNWETGTPSTTSFGFDTSLTFALEETAGDVTYGAEVSIDADAGTLSDGVIWVSGGFGKVSFGIDEFGELTADVSPLSTDGVNGVTETSEYGDVKYEGSFGAVSATLVADAGLGTTPGTGIAATEATWWLGLDYDGGSWTLGLETDSNNSTEVSVSADVGSFKVGGTVDNGSPTGWDVWASGSFGDVNAKVTYDDAGVTGLELDGSAGDVAWAVSGDSAGATTASIDYSMGDLSIGVAYDNDDAGCVSGGGACAATTNGEDYGDEADLQLTVGYSMDMLDFELKANDQSEYEISMTAGFTF